MARVILLERLPSDREAALLFEAMGLSKKTLMVPSKRGTWFTIRSSSAERCVEVLALLEWDFELDEDLDV